MNNAIQAIHGPEAHAVCFPTLPEGIQRHHVEALLLDLGGAIGLSRSLLITLLRMIKDTRPSDWTSPDVEPVCYMQQTKIAERLEKTERQVRNDEAALCKLKLATKNVAGNGGRGRIRHPDGSEFRQGIVFTPLIEAYQALVAIRDERARARATTLTLRRHCSSLRRKIKVCLRELAHARPSNTQVKDLITEADQWPHGYGSYKTIDQLNAHHDELVTMLETVNRISNFKENTSGEPEAMFRPYIQDTTEEILVPCKQAVDKMTACKQADTKISETKPDGSVICLEKSVRAETEAHNSKFISRLTPERLRALCSDEMRLYIDAFKSTLGPLSQDDFINAASQRVPELGISASAYRDAVTQMTALGAALCILVIDQNRHHPTTPIRRPGGALRAMTRRAAAGNLQIVGSLIGLSERLKTGNQ
ncbi:replication initiation protein RepC [Roseobacter weihaiensis]|uniref:replication initiation protein RepC n=1 Tax=Roseobacter weihaiensis TaxID=2763262 RepID=UPI001D09E337|nr:replication initiation protein RepC [Roseobacter sp. H9]